MRELVEYIAKNLVEDPEAVRVTEAEEEDAIVLEVRVAPEDMGRIIGRQGRIAKVLPFKFQAFDFRRINLVFGPVLRKPVSEALVIIGRSTECLKI